MAPDRPALPRTLRVGILLLVGIGAAVGLAAAFLRSPASPGAGPAPSPSTTFILSPLLLGSVIVGVCLTALVFFLVYQFRQGRSPFPAQVVVGFLLVLLLLVGFVALSHLFTGTTAPSGNSTAPATSNQTGPSPTNSTHGILTGPGGSVQTLGLSIPVWLLGLLAAAAAIAVGYVALPFLTSLRRRPGKDDETPRSRAELGRILRRSLDEISNAPTDPRPAIVELYGRLLELVGPMVGGVEFDTASEIQLRHLTRLGVGAATAESLTRLFEIARYSSLPLGPEDRERARTAISQAMSELDRAGRRPS
ncbi:MAG: DUF4129 domain-containing protein [Thermoplasmata archaeon]